MRYKKKSPFKIWVFVLVLSAILTVLLNPLVKYIYPLSYENEIADAAKDNGLNKYLVMGIISAESNFDTEAVSHKDAHGLMQIKDETALWCIEKFELDISPEDIRSPEANIQIGCAYMSYLLERFDGNMTCAIAAYNAGPENVKNWLNDPRYSDGHGNLKQIPFAETSAYVKRVQKRLEVYRKIYP
jgi:soluble lytic murein transglycosylase